MRVHSQQKTHKQQADAYLSQADPVSTTLYTVLDTTKDVRIISIACRVTWAVTQPTPLEVVVTVDGNTLTFVQANPVSTTWYYPTISPASAGTAQEMSTINILSAYLMRSFMLEGQSVKVQVRITWAITQPTPLLCRVKYSKLV